MLIIDMGIGWKQNQDGTLSSANPGDYADEVTRLHSIIKGIEIALARDENITAALRLAQTAKTG